MRLYSVEDVHNYHFLANKYLELADDAEKIMQEKGCHGKDGIELKFALTQIKTAKDMMDELGTEVPDDKAKELGFNVM